MRLALALFRLGFHPCYAWGGLDFGTVNNLTPQIARHVGDVYPTITFFCNKLCELEVTLLLHLHDELEQLAVVGTVAGDEVGGTPEDVVAVLGTTHERVELLAAVATADNDGLAPRFAYGVEELLY